MKVSVFSWDLEVLLRLPVVIALRIRVVRFRIEFLTTISAVLSHCTALLVGNFETRPVILNILVKVLYPTIVCSSWSRATQVTANLPSLVSQILDLLSQKHLRSSMLSLFLQ